MSKFIRRARFISFYSFNKLNCKSNIFFAVISRDEGEFSEDFFIDILPDGKDVGLKAKMLLLVGCGWREQLHRHYDRNRLVKSKQTHINLNIVLHIR